MSSAKAAISACEKGDQWQEALGLLVGMQKAELVPDAISYKAAIGAFEKGEQWQHALGPEAFTQKPDWVPNAISNNAAIGFSRSDPRDPL